MRCGLYVPLAQHPGMATAAWVLVLLIAIPPLPASPGGGGSGTVVRRSLITDHLGSGVVWVDASGDRQVHREFSSFGKVDAEVSIPTAGPPTIYAGHRREEATGLDYMQARWFDAETGRFTSIDPLVPSLSNPQTHNGYSYVNNNPMNDIDPDGACAIGDCWYYFDSGYQGLSPSAVSAVQSAVQRANDGGEVRTKAEKGIGLSHGSRGQSGLATEGGAQARGGSSQGSGAAGEQGAGSLREDHSHHKQNQDGTQHPDMVYTYNRPLSDSWAETIFRYTIFDYKDPLGGSYVLEALSMVGPGRILKGGKLAVKAAKWGSSQRRAAWKVFGRADGTPPKREVLVRRRNGQIQQREESMELHHRAPRRHGGSNSLENLERLWPTDHAKVDPHRHTGYDVIKVLRGPY